MDVMALTLTATEPLMMERFLTRVNKNARRLATAGMLRDREQVMTAAGMIPEAQHMKIRRIKAAKRCAIPGTMTATRSLMSRSSDLRSQYATRAQQAGAFPIIFRYGMRTAYPQWISCKAWEIRINVEDKKGENYEKNNTVFGICCIFSCICVCGNRDEVVQPRSDVCFRASCRNTDY